MRLSRQFSWVDFVSPTTLHVVEAGTGKDYGSSCDLTFHEARLIRLLSQLGEAVSGRFNPHVHVEYDWNLRLDELDESDDEIEEKVSVGSTFCPCTPSFFF